MFFEKLQRAFFYDFYHAFYYSLLVISAVAGMLYFKRAAKPYKWVAVLIVFTLVSELTSKFVAYSLHRSTDIVDYISTPIEFFLYVGIYKNFLQTKRWKVLLTWGAVIFFSAEIINTIFFQNLKQTPTNILILESILLVFLSLSLFLRIRETGIFENILKAGVFWFNSAALIYYSFNILVWGFHSIKVYQFKNPPAIMYQLLLLFSGILYFMYAASIILNNYTTRNTKP